MVESPEALGKNTTVVTIETAPSDPATLGQPPQAAPEGATVLPTTTAAISTGVAIGMTLGEAVAAAEHARTDAATAREQLAQAETECQRVKSEHESLTSDHQALLSRIAAEETARAEATVVDTATELIDVPTTPTPAPAPEPLKSRNPLMRVLLG